MVCIGEEETSTMFFIETRECLSDTMNQVAERSRTVSNVCQTLSSEVNEHCSVQAYVMKHVYT